MKKNLLIYLFIACSMHSFGQFPVAVEPVYAFIKNNSVFRNKIDWQKMDASFSSCIGAAKTIKDSMNCFVSVFKELNDVHSYFMLNYQYYGHYNPVEDSVYKYIKPIKERAEAANGKIYSTTLAENYAYVRVPAIAAYGAVQINKYAQALYDSICGFNQKKIKGFIIDLRLNTGGNMYPMLSGLSSLSGSTTIGYEVDINDSIIRKWEISNNNFIIGGHQATAITQSCAADYSKMPVVVLTGPLTSSSGSMAAIAFKKRANTYFIGEPTADGYTTSNGYFQFAPNLTLYLAGHFVADRKMSVYKTSVNPDLAIYKGDDFDFLMKDEKIKAALQWLSAKK